MNYTDSTTAYPPIPRHSHGGLPRRAKASLFILLAGSLAAAVLAFTNHGHGVATSSPGTTSAGPASSGAGAVQPASGAAAGSMVAARVSGVVNTSGAGSFTLFVRHQGASVTVSFGSATTFMDANGSSVSASAIRPGTRVQVEGSTSGSTASISAQRVFVLGAGYGRHDGYGDAGQGRGGDDGNRSGSSEQGSPGSGA
jgi:hypothetical protein